MEYREEYFQKASGMSWAGVLRGISKSQNPYQPIFEAITNSLESIQLRLNQDKDFNPCITISLFYNGDLQGNRSGLSKIEIQDNGIGLGNRDFRRLSCFKDDSKSIVNRGSGRIQFIHFFVETYFHSIYKEGDSYFERNVELSKKAEFLSKNSVCYSEPAKSTNNREILTTVTLKDLRDDKDIKIYDNINLNILKTDILNKYMLLLCNFIKKPVIRIRIYIQGEIKDDDAITSTDIPQPTKDDFSFNVFKSKLSEDKKHIEHSQESITVYGTPYVLPENALDNNEIILTCKGELIDEPKIKTTFLNKESTIDNNRYLILLHSDYFDTISSDVRGVLPIYTKSDFKKAIKSNVNIPDQVLIDDIQEIANTKIKDNFEEISEESEKRIDLVERLKKEYLIADEALEGVKDCDDVEDILRKAYTYDAEKQAQVDASYNESVAKLDGLNTTQPEYQEELNKVVDELIKNTPLKNRTELSRYVARRSMIIELMRKILDHRTQVQQVGRNIDEKILHNLIFSQHSDNPNESDLWLLSEEYMYFRGFSEHRLNEIRIDGQPLFREVVSKEEDEYLNASGHNRLLQRPDILLFPSEGKCIIIELKNPDVELQDHLNQINKYAYFIRNYTNENFVIDEFFGYLIGDNLVPKDVRAADSDFKQVTDLDIMYRPHKNVADDSGSKHDGDLYTEVLTFSALQKRAERRNQVFKDKLFGSNNNEA